MKLFKRIKWGKVNDHNFCIWIDRKICGIGFLIDTDPPKIYFCKKSIVVTFKFLWVGAWYSYDIKLKTN